MKQNSKNFKCLRRLGWICGLLLSVPQIASADSAATFFDRGVNAYNDGDFDISLTWLDKAQGATRDPKILAQIHLYIGINHAVLGRDQAALVAFRTALSFDEQMELSADDFKKSIIALFQQAKRELAARPIPPVQNEPKPVQPITAQPVLQPRPSPALPSERSAPSTKRRFSIGQLRWTWVTLALTAASFGAGAGVWRSAQTDHETWTKLPQADWQRPKALDLENHIQKKANAVVALNIVGGVMAASSIVLFFFEGYRNPERPTSLARTRLGPLIGDRLGGALQLVF